MSTTISQDCLSSQNDASVTSFSTIHFVPQPLPFKCHYIQNRIFVGNLPPNACRREIIQLFRQFGEITETNLIQDEGRVIAFVTFTNVDSANAVLSLYKRGRPFMLHGYMIKINRAYFKPKKPSPQDNFDNSQQIVSLLNNQIGFGGVYYNGMVYYQQLSQMGNVHNGMQSREGLWNFQSLQQALPQPQAFQTPPGSHLSPILPPPPHYPIVQQTYQTEYNINHNVNINQFLPQTPDTLRMSEYEDNGYSSMQEASSCEDLNHVGQTGENQDANTLSFVWCTNENCLQNSNDNK